MEFFMSKILVNIAAAILSVSAFCCVSEQNRNVLRAEALLTKATDYLWSKQADDGGWHSETHGILRGGQAWSPFVLLALVDAPGTIARRKDSAVERGLEFVRAHVNDEGVLGLSDPDVFEYPNYATSYAVRLLVREEGKNDGPLIARMSDYLASQQLTEHRGFTEQDPVYGAWGFGETNLPPGTPGFADLSHTRRVLQALHDAGFEDSTACRKAELFLRIVQKHPAETRRQPGMEDGTQGTPSYDGGFYFSPVVVARNKGGMENSGLFRSYATATCDGVLALFLAGVPRDDERMVSALNWLSSHPLLDHPEGIPEDSPDRWQDVMFFYHLLVRSEVYSTFGVEGPWRSEIISLLEQRQHADGSFANPSGELNKEDDPILATAMVVYILTNMIR